MVSLDISSAMALVGSTPVYIQEAGFPTSGTNLSSVDMQAAFVDQMFSSWDAYATKIPFISFLRMNDLSLAAASSTAATYGLSGNPQFVAYLQTLGFRSYTTPSAFKSAWTNIQNRTHERGW